MSSEGTIKKVAGPLVIATGMRDANMYDVVRVSDEKLTGEIIEMHGDQASIQVYDRTWTWRAGSFNGRSYVSRTWAWTDRQHLRRYSETSGRDHEDLGEQP